MSDTPTTPAPPAPPSPSAKPAKTSTAAKARGVHVVFNKDDDVVTIYSGEIDSLRKAMEVGGTARHVAFGERLDGGT